MACYAVYSITVRLSFSDLTYGAQRWVGSTCIDYAGPGGAGLVSGVLSRCNSI
jgi:hypothetical protein